MLILSRYTLDHFEFGDVLNNATMKTIVSISWLLQNMVPQFCEEFI